MDCGLIIQSDYPIRKESMLTRTQAISNFLIKMARPDLARLYNQDMEVQVNVAQDGGERVEGDFKGKHWQGWTDGMTTWKPFRIPYKANTDPEYTDVMIGYDLAEHVEGIGMTGWDWKNKVSRWVAFDFDSILCHKDGLSFEELRTVQESVQQIPWVTVRKSTSGQGIHLYVDLLETTANHTEHAALARAVLGKLSALAGFDFSSKIDVCGGNMWVWHRKTKGTDGLITIKQGEKLEDVPANWRDHCKVVSGHRRKNLPQDIEKAGKTDAFDELCGQRQRTALDDDHKKLINWLRDNNAFWWWDQDNNMLVTHTGWLKQAHDSLGLRGIFNTSSACTNLNEQNCFLHPIRKGSWAVRRFGQGIQEHDSWTQDSNGWTRCYLNRDPDLATACRSKGGLEDPKGGFIFREALVASTVANTMGVSIDLKPVYHTRETKIMSHKDGRMLVEIEKKDTDRSDEMEGWLPKKDKWIRIFNTSNQALAEIEVGSYDDLIRHMVSCSNEDAGWVIKSDSKWRDEPLSHIKYALTALGLKPNDGAGVIGQAVSTPWTIVNLPFQPEYPGDREWNRDSAQLRFTPNPNTDNLKYDTWMKVLRHCGSSLDSVLKNVPWAKSNGILTGGDYLKVWVASLFQQPTQPLPYLFLYNPAQQTGKSTLHEALSILLTKGYQRVDNALVNPQGFNGEMAGAILCVVEETDLRASKVAYNRIKDWVTSRDLPIHPKNGTPYQTVNTTHYIQCSNPRESCPIFGNDTRITMLFVPELTDNIPKAELFRRLEKEAPDFLAEVLSLEIPLAVDRLNIPAIDTADKRQASDSNKSQLELFLEEKCKFAEGETIKFSDLYDMFMEFCDPGEVRNWSKIRLGREMPVMYPKGRMKNANAQYFFGNICPKDKVCPTTTFRYALQGEWLEMVPL